MAVPSHAGGKVIWSPLGSPLKLPKHKRVSQGGSHLSCALFTCCLCRWVGGLAKGKPISTRSSNLRAQVSPETLMPLQALLKPEVRR